MCSDRSAHSSNFRFTELWLCCLPCFSCRRLASHLWKIFARSMAVKDFRSVCSSQDSRFGTTWFPSSFARNTIASSSAPNANFNCLTAFSVSMPARLTLSVAWARPFRSWVTWWDNGFAEHGNGFCLGLSVSVLIGRDREYRINYLWAIKRLISCKNMPYLIAVKQRKVLQEEDAGSTALIKLIGQKGSIRLTKPKDDYPSVCSIWLKYIGWLFRLLYAVWPCVP